jgi:hypothetical protein
VDDIKPTVVFLMETRMDCDRGLGLKRKLGFANGEVVSSDGLSGGLVLLWRGNVTVAIQSLSKFHIDALLSCPDLGIHQLRLTGFYGEPRKELRKNSWFLMHFLRGQLDTPWLCVGDFNEVLSGDEYFGAHSRERWQVDAFQQTVEDCRLMDLGFQGLPYTWDNRQEGDRNVKVRLDGALGDYKFMEVLADIEVRHVPFAESDHCAVVVKIQKRQRAGSRRRRRRRRVFRYENMWQRHDTYMDFVQQAWDPGPASANLNSVAGALASLQTSFSKWNKNVFGFVKRKIEQLKLELERVRSSTLYCGPTSREKEVMVQLSEALAREEIMERQRARVDWLRDGDHNTGFFQAKAKARARTNKISCLKNEAGELIRDQDRLESMASQFYQGLFTGQEELDPELVCSYVPRKVSGLMNEMLDRPFTV